MFVYIYIYVYLCIFMYIIIYIYIYANTFLVVYERTVLESSIKIFERFIKNLEKEQSKTDGMYLFYIFAFFFIILNKFKLFFIDYVEFFYNLIVDIKKFYI